MGPSRRDFSFQAPYFFFFLTSFPQTTFVGIPLERRTKAFTHPLLSHKRFVSGRKQVKCSCQCPTETGFDLTIVTLNIFSLVIS